MEAKEALDKIIRKSRVHFYKPIQIAEILHRHRTVGSFGVNRLERYRNASKKWRDEVSLRLIGSVSTSSQKFQDNLFEENAMPPRHIAELAKINEETNGIVEAYIYQSLRKRLSSVFNVKNYIEQSSAETFSLNELVSFFVRQPGLKRSVDKIYEITVYALFAAIVRALEVYVTLEVRNRDEAILKDFERFISTVLGVDAGHTRIDMQAELYRMGVANAADTGLDMFANFGAAVQVKHLTLTPEVIEDIAEGLPADRIVVVCKDAEKDAIDTLLKQVGWGSRIQGIITLSDLDAWYALCLSEKYRQKLGKFLLDDLEGEFKLEFPSTVNIEPFLRDRGYDIIQLAGDWEVAA